MAYKYKKDSEGYAVTLDGVALGKVVKRYGGRFGMMWVPVTQDGATLGEWATRSHAADCLAIHGGRLATPTTEG